MIVALGVLEDCLGRLMSKFVMIPSVYCRHLQDRTFNQIIKELSLNVSLFVMKVYVENLLIQMQVLTLNAEYSDFSCYCLEVIFWLLCTFQSDILGDDPELVWYLTGTLHFSIQIFH